MSSDQDDPTLPLDPDDADKTQPTGAKDSGTDETIVSNPGDDPTLAAPSPPAGRREDEDTSAIPGRPSSELEVNAPGATHVFANRFEVVALLGEGGMGRVYQVRDRQIEGREVALKVLRPRYSRNQRFRDLFFQEIRAAQNFVSEQVNQVRDTGQMDDGRLFLTMDLVEGESLRELLKRERSLNTRHALEITRQILLALQSGHDQGFVHRDVKPPNIMLLARVPKTDENPYGVGVRLLDFGIAALAAEVGEGTVSGTLTYMSPEQAQGQRLDARSDLFSVGIVLYEMLSGSRPFEGKTLQEISTALIETQIAPMIKELDHLKPAVQTILRKALEKDRDKRYQSAAEFIEAIEKSKAYRLPTGVPAWVGGLLAVSVVAAVGAGGVLWTTQQELALAREEGSKDRDKWISEREAALESQRAQFEKQRTDTENSYKQIIADKDSLIGKLQQRVAELDTSGVETKVDENELQRLSSLVQEQSTEITQLRQDYSKLQTDYRKVKDRQDQNERASNPSARAAKGLDLMLEYVAGGHWGQAAEHWTGLDADGVFERSDVGGGEQLAAFADGAESLARYRERMAQGGPRDRSLLVAADRSAAQAQGGLEIFGAAAGSWLAFRLDGETAAPDRMSQFSEAITTLRATIADELTALDAQNLAEAEELITGDASQDPAKVIELGEEVGWETLDDFLKRLVASISRAESGGHIDRTALANDPVLDAWGEYVSSSRNTVPEPYADTLRWFWTAKRWYVDGGQLPEGGWVRPPGLESISPDLTPETPDWRAVLALQVELFHALPRIVDDSRYYLERSSRGDVLWIEDRVTGGVDRGGSDLAWTVDRTTYDPDRDKTTTAHRFAEGVLYGAGDQPLVDLFDPDARVGFWRATEKERAPALQRFPNDQELSAFNTRFGDPGAVSLVVKDDNGIERWFSPVLGSVHVSRDGVFEVDLLFASL